MPPAMLEPLFLKWENKWHDAGGKDINNPKIPVSFVTQNGTVVWQAGDGPVIEKIEAIAKDERPAKDSADIFDVLMKDKPKK